MSIFAIGRLVKAATDEYSRVLTTCASLVQSSLYDHCYVVKTASEKDKSLELSYIVNKNQFTFKPSILFIVRSGERLVAMVQAVIQDKGRVLVCNFYVIPEYRGRKLGTFLLSLVKTLFHNSDMELEAKGFGDKSMSNKVLKRMYARHGFREESPGSNRMVCIRSERYHG